MTDAYSLDKQFLNDDDVNRLKTPDHPFSRLLESGVRKASDLHASDYGMFFALRRLREYTIIRTR